jgi:hypothetical protein
VIRAILIGAINAAQIALVGAIGAVGNDAYERLKPGVLDAIAPVVAVAGLLTVIVIAIANTREVPRGRRDR